VSDSHSLSVYGIVLAAGASSRFGSPKQCAALGGEALISRAIGAATAVLGPAIRVVLGAHAAEIAPLLDLQAEQIAFNRHWTAGIASSIRAGIASLPHTCAGAVLLLADQPYVSAAGVGRLISAWRHAPEHIIASRYGAVIGAPCLFPRWCFHDLEALEGDQGARALLSCLRKHLVFVEHPEAGIDIDTPQQLAEQQAFD
jgi:molybdenum cofactor cytidylyltransferase